MIYLDKEFEKFWNKIETGENFAFIRNADGERAIMLGKAVAAQERNWESPNYVTKLGEDILKSLSIKDDRVHYAISCPCCDNEAYYWYSTRISNKNHTFANLWINKNYQSFVKIFPELKRDAVLIANFRARGHKIGNLNILKHYEISDDCISFWENEASQMLEQIKKDFGNCDDLLYVVSAGPMSSPIIANLFQNNPNNCYIDFGSAIDSYYREEITRPYMIKGNVYAERNCYMADPKNANFDVSVVLNLYKRPECLKLQLEAIKAQSLKPKEILLFHDAVEDGEKIKIPLDIIFDDVYESPENVGVWGRFEYAMQTVKSKYVCLLDDDTIPGRRWLENCHTQMLKQRGLYGAVGIIMKRPDRYPFGGFVRVGWYFPWNKTVEVDFVGHSWFLEKDWLEYMFQAPQEVRSFKTAGEDMSLSCYLYKNAGLRTFVPPHPIKNLAMHGSNPEFAMKFGRDKGISCTEHGLSQMNNGIKTLLLQGWRPIAKQNLFKAYYLYYRVKVIKKMRQIKHLIKKTKKVD